MTNDLDKNFELRKALAEVDRLTSENVSLDYVCSQQDTIIKDLKDDVNRLTKEQSINLDIIQTQKKRLRSNEVMLRSHERDITALQNKIEELELRSKMDFERKKELYAQIQELKNQIEMFRAINEFETK